MRIAVCDDEETMAAQVEQLTRRWDALRSRSCPCQICRFASSEELLFETGGSYPFDLMLLDIELGGGLTGLELARRIRRTDPQVGLAFLTNYPEHVFEGYEVAALRYLLKPVTADPLFALLDLVQERMDRTCRYLVLDPDGEPRRVAEEDILYLEACGHTVRIETLNGPQTVRRTFRALAQELSDDFVPAHRSFLVNLRHLEQVGRTECLLEGGRRVPVSRGAWEALNRAFLACYREVRP